MASQVPQAMQLSSAASQNRKRSRLQDQSIMGDIHELNSRSPQMTLLPLPEYDELRYMLNKTISVPTNWTNSVGKYNCLDHKLEWKLSEDGEYLELIFRRKPRRTSRNRQPLQVLKHLSLKELRDQLEHHGVPQQILDRIKAELLPDAINLRYSVKLRTQQVPQKIRRTSKNG